MERQLPENLNNKSALCIGVGSGYELESILSRKPRTVVGIDLSEKLLEIASTNYPNVEFKNADMMHMPFADESFDLVYSSLTFHYANDWDALLSEVYRVLQKGGTLLFSTHHPAYWSQQPKTGNVFANRRGVTLTEHTATLPAGGVDITFYNHPDEQSIIDALKQAGFALRSFFAPSVVELSETSYSSLKGEEREAYDNLKTKNRKTPLFLVGSAKKSAETHA